jgi:hypothetical protein
MAEYVPVAPVSDDAKKHNQNLPGMGGVFNYVNLHVYHYGANNPIMYVDPNGEADVVFYQINPDGFEDQANNSGYFNSSSEDVIMIGVSSADQFISAWNNLDDSDIDDIYLFLHGGEGFIRFGSGENRTFLRLTDNDFDKLENKNVNGKVYLFSCSGGKGSEGNNVAWKLVELTSTSVRATDNKVSFSMLFGKYQARIGGGIRAFLFGSWADYYNEKKYVFFGEVVPKSKSTRRVWAE